MKAIKKEILACPNCKNAELTFCQSSHRMLCSLCNKEYDFSGDKFYFSEHTEDDITDFLDKVKHTFKKYRTLYKALIDIISPVYTGNVGLKKFIKKHIAGKDVVALNLGSGNGDLHENISNVDLFRYDNVDVTADLLNLPIRDNAVDAIINVAVLEHIPSPEKAVTA